MTTQAPPSRKVTTARGITCEVREYGQGPSLLYLHGATGLAEKEPLLDLLAARYHVYAPVWPGYGEDEGEDLIEDMLDFTLHSWDVIDALALLDRPHVVGHSMGGMIAAEMAALNPHAVEKLVLIDAFGLWLDEHPIPDIFATMPFQMASLLFHDESKGEGVLTRGRNFGDTNALRDFMVGNARRLGTAGKIMFPIPNRRLSKRLYRLTVPTLVVWGREDRLMPPVYADRWSELLPDARLTLIDEAGHMTPYEQPEAVSRAIVSFLA
jgi:pimeloyl-ACP methyl ester carboxylesterase